VTGTPSIDLSVAQTITWKTDSEQDAKTITKIALVVPPPVGSTDLMTPVSSTNIASDVTTADLKYVMQPVSGLKVNETYQIWFYGAYNSTTQGILAESPFFKAGKISSSAASTTAGGNTPSPTGTTTTVSATKKANAGNALKAFGGAGLLTALTFLVL
jgi:hypothetical protein